ncbi:hypothetical protein SDC9_139907 [bioreactor metagenome]|uniref:Uncharacterized protein n=1 Tax=bioreactor metagenome TaxID=1076179 RepID=A0A645DTY1_9ZZZZ
MKKVDEIPKINKTVFLNNDVLTKLNFFPSMSISELLERILIYTGKIGTMQGDKKDSNPSTKTNNNFENSTK